MRARNHVILSTGVSVVVQAVTHSWPATIGCFFSGILIDVDHYWEYYIHRGKFPLRYKDLSDFCHDYQERKVYLIFHAYEYLAVFWALIYFLHLGGVWLGIAIGVTAHIIADQFTNPIKPLFYFLTFRVINGFETSKINDNERFSRKL